MSDKPIRFYDLPQTAYPFTMILRDADDLDRVVYEVIVEDPGVMDIPSAKSLGVRAVEVTITYGDGSVHNSWDGE